MKHATAAALAQLAELLDQLRNRPGLKEKSFGIFYRRSRSFLHFHEDQAGLFADVRAVDGWDRFSANTKSDCAKLLSAIDEALRLS